VLGAQCSSELLQCWGPSAPVSYSSAGGPVLQRATPVLGVLGPVAPVSYSSTGGPVNHNKPGAPPARPFRGRASDGILSNSLTRRRLCQGVAHTISASTRARTVRKGAWNRSISEKNLNRASAFSKEPRGSAMSAATQTAPGHPQNQPKKPI